MKKIWVMLLLTAISVGTLGACGKEASKNNEKDDLVASDGSEVLTEEKTAKYESYTLELCDDFQLEDEDINGKITDLVFASNFSAHLLTSDNEIYTDEFTQFEYTFTVDENFEKLLPQTCYGNILVQNEDGSYTIYDKYNTDSVFTFEAENMVLAYINYGTLNVFTLEDNHLYVQGERGDGTPISKNPVYVDIDTGLGTNFADVEVKDVILRGEWLEILTTDGELYCVEPAYVNTDSSLELSGGWAISDVDKTYASGSVIYYMQPFYSLNSDSYHLYVREGITDQVTHPIPLPEGYETSDIQELHAVQEVLLVMNDGNIYYMEDATEGGSWELVEELTELNKEGHIKSFAETNTAILILCDDNYLYKLYY